MLDNTWQYSGLLTLFRNHGVPWGPYVMLGIKLESATYMQGKFLNPVLSVSQVQCHGLLQLGSTLVLNLLTFYSAPHLTISINVEAPLPSQLFGFLLGLHFYIVFSAQ